MSPFPKIIMAPSKITLPHGFRFTTVVIFVITHYHLVLNIETWLQKSLDQFQFRWLIKHHLDRDDSSNSYPDSFILNHLKRKGLNIDQVYTEICRYLKELWEYLIKEPNFYFHTHVVELDTV